MVLKDEKTNNLVLNDEALNSIRDLDGKIAVCSCIGEYRSGKSFLSSNNAFQVGHEETSCTKGCWINNYLIKLKDEVTPMSQTKNDSKRETFFVNY